MFDYIAISYPHTRHTCYQDFPKTASSRPLNRLRLIKPGEEIQTFMQLTAKHVHKVALRIFKK